MKRRWRKPNIHCPLSTQRTKAGFLIFPRSIDGVVRWLEDASWQERLTTGGLTEPPFWMATAWIYPMEADDE